MQAVYRFGHSYQMNMIGHQAVSQNFKSVLKAILMKPFQISLIIFFNKKDIFSSITPLGNVVGYIGKNRPCEARH